MAGVRFIAFFSWPVHRYAADRQDAIVRPEALYGLEGDHRRNLFFNRAHLPQASFSTRLKANDYTPVNDPLYADLRPYSLPPAFGVFPFPVSIFLPRQPFGRPAATCSSAPLPLDRWTPGRAGFIVYRSAEPIGPVLKEQSLGNSVLAFIRLRGAVPAFRFFTDQILGDWTDSYNMLAHIFRITY